MSAPSDGDVFWECACYCQPGLSWQGREERITIFHSVCIVGAPEVTPALPLPLLDWSCQSRSAHVCVILNSQHSCRCGTLKWADFSNMYDYTWECGRCACVHRFTQSGKYSQDERMPLTCYCFAVNAHNRIIPQNQFRGERAETWYHAVSSIPAQLNWMPLICSPASVVDLVQTPMTCF